MKANSNHIEFSIPTYNLNHHHVRITKLKKGLVE